MEDSHVAEFKAIRMREGEREKESLGRRVQSHPHGLGVRTLDTVFSAVYMAWGWVGYHGQRSRPSAWRGGPDYRGQVHPYDLGLSTSPKVEGGGGGILDTKPAM